jgi:hypothetical protein
MTAVERHLSRIVGIAGDRSKYRLPDAALTLAGKTIVDCFVRTVFARAVFPAAANPLHVHDAAQYAPIILSVGPGWLGGKCGSISAHCSSLNQNRLGFMVGLPVG